MKTNKIFDNVFVAIILIVALIFACSIGGISGIINFVLSFGSEILKVLGCFVLFFVICLVFPKSWFAKIFKDKL